ncbi:hypothetical protein Tco_1366790 [Tanacetum coccineum]
MFKGIRLLVTNNDTKFAVSYAFRFNSNIVSFCVLSDNWRPIVSRPPLAMLNISFSKHDDEERRQSYLPAEHSQIQARSVDNTIYDINELSASDVLKRGCPHSLSTVTSKEASLTGIYDINELSASDVLKRGCPHNILGHPASLPTMETVNHAYLCLDVRDCIIRPEIITFPHSSRKNTYQGHACAEHYDVNHRLLHNKGNDYSRRAEYHLCYGGGKIYMPQPPDPLVFIQHLLRNNHFMEHIRAYNQMFAMMSFGAKVDDSVNKGKGPYVFKISGQIYHWIGSLYLEEGHHPRFL